MQAFAIIALTVAAAIVYGVAHDQVTARVCVEYFTIGHPRVVDSDSPTLLAFTWGVLATWWAGLIGGVVLSVSARAGSRPKLGTRQLIRPLAWLLLVMAALSLVAGVVGWNLAASGGVYLVGPIASAVPPDKHVPFLANLWAHSAAYLIGFIGVVTLAILTWRRRRRLAVSGEYASPAPRVNGRPTFERPVPSRVTDKNVCPPRRPS